MLGRLFKRAPRPELPEELWQAATAPFPVLQGWPETSQRRLRHLTQAFLSTKKLRCVEDLELTDVDLVGLAALACVPVVGLDLSYYRDFVTVIVYPSEFAVPREEIDEAGVMHLGESVLSGEAWEAGPVVLSWADVLASGQGAGYNVVIHEMAHQIDAGNGIVNGFPPLHGGMCAQTWTRHFHAAYEALNAALAAEQDTFLDPYAGEAPEEFFAVACEAFFEQPDAFARALPDIYALLQSFFRFDPGARILEAG